MILNLTFANILHRPVRSIVTVSGIGVGALLILFTYGLADGTLRGNARREANIGAEIIVRASGTFGLSGTEPLRLPVEQVSELSKLEGVQMAVPIAQNLDAADDSETGTRLIDGVNYDEYSRIAGLWVDEGRAIATEGREAMVDRAWQQQKNIRIGSTLRIYGKDFRVVGAYEPASGARIKIPLKTMQEELTGDTDKCTAILVKVGESSQQEAVGERIAHSFVNDQVIFTKDFEELYMQSVPALGVFLDVVTGIAAVVSTLVILLTMYTAVAERTKQIGILKSLGMSKIGILWTITQEAMLISLLGAVLGLILSILLRFALTFTTSSMQVSFDLKLLFLTLTGVLTSGITGSLYPAIRAARLDAVKTLSYE
jgi:putative ABC transport system permease protein